MQKKYIYLLFGGKFGGKFGGIAKAVNKRLCAVSDADLFLYFPVLIVCADPIRVLKVTAGYVWRCLWQWVFMRFGLLAGVSPVYSRKNKKGF